MKQHTKKIIHPIAKEFRMERCCFDNTPPRNFVKSQWQNRSKSWIYLIYRWCLALFFIAVVIESMIASVSEGYYFIYLTNWGIILCMLTNTIGAALVTIWHFHPEYADRVIDNNSMPYAFKIYWAMHICSLITSIDITIIYWGFLYNTETVITVTNVLTHAFNSVFMFLDLMIVAYPIRLLHIFVPITFGLTYAFFSVIYYECGGLDPRGKPYIYNILDWTQPKKAIITVFSVIILCALTYTFIFAIYKLRIFIFKRLNRESVILPTTDKSGTLNSKTPPIVTHPPNGISMVLGDFGIENKGFTQNEDKIA